MCLLVKVFAYRALASRVRSTNKEARLDSRKKSKRASGERINDGGIVVSLCPRTRTVEVSRGKERLPPCPWTGLRASEARSGGGERESALAVLLRHDARAEESHLKGFQSRSGIR